MRFLPGPMRRYSSRAPLFMNSCTMRMGSSLEHTAYKATKCLCLNFFMMAASSKKACGDMDPGLRVFTATGRSFHTPGREYLRVRIVPHFGGSHYLATLRQSFRNRVFCPVALPTCRFPTGPAWLTTSPTILVLASGTPP
jgi:hypothetical protein